MSRPVKVRRICSMPQVREFIPVSYTHLNGIGADAITVYSGDIVGDERIYRKTAGKYDLIFANIVADVIIALAGKIPPLLAEKGIFVCSGIIEGDVYKRQSLYCPYRQSEN